MRRLTFLFVVTFALNGCALTRVTKTAHDEEVRHLNLIGLSHDEAILRLTSSGFTCYDARLSSRNYRDCFKTSAEFFCPQKREVALALDSNGSQILSVRTNIVEKACF